MFNCIDIDNSEVQKLSQELGLHKAVVAAKVAVWQENNNTSDFPKVEDLFIQPENIKVIPENISSKGSEFVKQLTNLAEEVANEVRGGKIANYNFNPSNVEESKRNEYKQYVLNTFGKPTINSFENKIEFTSKDTTIIINKDGSLSYPKGTLFLSEISRKDPNYDIKFMIGLNKIAEDSGKILNTFSIMTDILTEKLKQHPELVQGIIERGGLAYIEQSTHNVNESKSSITKENWNKDSPKENPNTAYVFTENINSIGSSRVGGGSAVIRNNPNAIGIVTKKYYVYAEDRATSKVTGGWNQDFQNTEADFDLFKKVNLEQFAKIDKFENKIFPQGFASDLAKIPTKFAEWLQTELLNRYGLVTELNANKTGLISKSIQSKTGDKFWESTGQNKFIEALAQAYKNIVPNQILQKTTSSNIHFLEEQTIGYKSRTIKNASADATIAIAVDFTSGGERLTKSSVEKQNKKYIPIDIKNNLKVTDEVINEVVNQLNEVSAKTLNIAGNGIYTMLGKYTQQQLDDYTYDLLNAVLNSPNLKNKIEKIRTGGQTGLDEAGAKAGKKLGIPTMILAPKDWTFRNENGQDINDEKQFKERFGTFTPQADLFSSNIFNENKQSNDTLVLRRIVDEYFNAKEISDIFQNIQALQQLIKGFKGTFAESEAFINALNKLGYDINKDFTDIEAHTKPTQQFYKNYNNVTSKVNGIDRVLNDKFLKQSIITAIDLMKVSKSFFVSQTSLAKSIRDNVSSLFKPFKASKTTFKNNFRKNFLSYLTVTAYINSVKNDEDLKIPHIKDFLLTPLDEVAEGKEYNNLQSKYFQILSYNRENGIKNDFLDFLQPSKVDYDKHSSSLLYNYRLNLMEMDSRNVKDPDKIQSLISGFNQLYFANNDNIIEKNEEVKRINNLKYEFARDMFKYLIVKDGLLYQNQSFIKAIDPILFLETSHKLDEIQELFKKENPSSSEFTKLFGMTKEELELDFVLKFSLHADNYFDLKSQKLGVILTEKKDRDALISKQKEEEKQADFAETDKIENAEYGNEENIDEELVQEDNYPLYWHNVDKSLTVNVFAGETTNMSTQEKKQNKAENKRYILSKENEIFKKIREPFETPDGQIKHYDVIGLPVTTYVNDKKGNTADRIPLKLAIVQNTIKIGNSFLNFQFTPEGKAVRVDSRTMTKLRNMGVMFTDLQNNSIFDIINDSAKLKLQTNKENIPNLIKIAKELSNFYRGGYIIGTRAKYEKTIILGSSKLSSFGDDLQSQMDIKMSEEEQGKVTLSMYNRKDKTIKDEDKRDILIAEINKYSTNTITKESAKNIETPNLEEALKRFIRTSSSNLTEKQIEDKIKECFKTK